MLGKGVVSARQLMILTILITVGDNILVLPSIPAVEAKQDAWISYLLGMAIGLPIVYLIRAAGSIYPQMTLVQYSQIILGRWIGAVVSLLFLVYPFLSAAAHVREIGDFMTTVIMPETPIEAVHILFLGIILIGVRLGLETITRASEFFFPLFVALFLALTLLLLPEVRVERILPMFEEGFKPIIRGSLTSAAFPFMELVVFMMIFPYVNEPKKVTRGFLLGACLGGIVLFVIILLAILVLGADITARHIYPSYALAKKISIGRFVERIEAIVAVMWILTTFFKITIYVFVLHLGIAQLFRLREYRMLVLPIGLMLAVFSLVISPNITYFSMVITKYWSYIDFTYAVMLPLVLAAGATFRKLLAKASMND